MMVISRIKLIFRKRFPLAFCLIVLGQSLYAYEHPGGMHPKAQIEFVKQQIKQKKEPYYSAFQQLVSFSDSALTEGHHALADFSIPGYYRKPAEHVRNSAGLAADAFNAYACTLAWQLCGEDKYAKRALYFINAWSSINKTYSESDGNLVMSYTGTAMIMAAELMSSYQEWEKADRQLFSEWVKNVYRKATNEIRTKQNNWADWGRFGSSLSDYYLDDTLDMNENVRLFKSDLFDKIAEDGHMPQETRRGANSLWYTYFSLSPITVSAWVVYNATGENLFALQKGQVSIKKALDYLMYYNLHPDEWKWYQHPVHGTWQSNFSDLDLKTYHSFWPANLLEAMSCVFEEKNYVSYVNPFRPLSYEQHHFAWVFTTLMPVSLKGYNDNAFLKKDFGGKTPFHFKLSEFGAQK